MFLLYSSLYLAGLCLLAPRALWHVLRGGRWGVALGQRLGRVPDSLRQHGGALWVHAVSVGEVHAARGLLPHLRRSFPDVPVVLSTTTVTGQAAAAQAGADACLYMPLDLPATLGPVFEALQPSAILLVETEIWPNLLRQAQRRRIPVGLVNARLSDRSYRRYHTLRRFWPEPTDILRLVCARTAVEAERFLRLGVDPARVYATGNLKADAAALSPPRQRVRTLGRELGLQAGAQVLVAGCTMPQEEEIVLEAFRAVRAEQPDAVLLLAPRHPERFDQVAKLVRSSGLTCQRRSSPEPNPDADVILLDSMGELPAAYGLGTVAFVGGSLVAGGGHNLLEPAVHGQPVLFGPHTENFAALAEQIERAGGGLRVPDGNALATAATRLLGDAEERRAMGTRARRVARHDAAAGSRTARVLARHLWG